MVDSNHRPRPYQGRTLTSWANIPVKFGLMAMIKNKANQLFIRRRKTALHFYKKTKKDQDSLIMISTIMLRLTWIGWFINYDQTLQSLKGGDPAAGSPTATLLRLHPSHRPHRGRSLLKVRVTASGWANSHGVTGGVYKARERIHRGILIRDY